MHRLWAILLGWLLSLAFALNTGRELAWNIFYLLTAAIVLSALWAYANVNGVRVARFTRARRAQVGKMAEEQFEVRNLSRLPKLWLEVRDFSTLPAHHASHVVSSLGGKRRQRWIVRTVCQQRGRFMLGPLTLTSGDPLGLFRFSRTLPATSPIVVYPITVDIPAFNPPIGILTGGDAMRRRTHYVTTNVSGVRDYEPGDSYNRIHWKSVARTGRLVVKEFELDPTADLWLIVDMDRNVHVKAPWHPVERDEGPAVLWKESRHGIALAPSTEEYVVSAAASLARHFILRNRSVGLIAHSRHREVIQADRGERQLTKILETLAVIEPLGNIPFSQVLTGEGQSLSRHTTLIVISSSPDPTWVAALRDLQRRGVYSVAVVVDAASFGPSVPSTPVLAELLASGIVTYVVKRDDPLNEALTVPAHART
ncbi:DUF58 domain-containing protein [Candidatus Amarolinea aalborgensis]|uniref:DUF58 domain-containing protein n=1 Tax=Candidatus Amarolinea aalborgensis TaxID=2249329 RepID=UPI003BF9701A